MMLKTSLLPYQKTAVDKLLRLKIGALYMEMGTGKTRTALEIIKLREQKIECVLWLCPCSVKTNLRADIDKHSSDNGIIRIEGIESMSGSVRLYQELIALAEDGTTMLVVDESNLVKNHYAIRSRRIISIAEKCKYRMILNGTPISKTEADLFSQWYLLDWRILGYRSYWSFAANHLEFDERIPGKIVRTLNIDYLTQKIAPYSYQVKKEECLQLPPKHYRTYYFSLTDDQQRHYDEIADEMLFDLDELQPTTIYRLFSALQSIACGRMVTEHKGNIKTAPFFTDHNNDPRLQALMGNLKTMNGKCIIFCRYTHEVLTVAEKIKKVYGNDSAVVFYGDIPQKNRQENLRLFSEDNRFMVANKNCAGYGLNLQFCSQVVYYSNDWDYATRVQSEDRVHRIGQEDDVTILDLCAYDTIDERIIKCLSRKEGMVSAFKQKIGTASKDELRKWLKGLEDTDGKTIH